MPFSGLPFPAQAQPASAFLTPTPLLPPGKKHTVKSHHLARYKAHQEKGFLFVYLSPQASGELALGIQGNMDLAGHHQEK